MTTIQGTIENGRIVAREPIHWADGSVVDITLRDGAENDIFNDTPESIARWIALAESIPAPTLSDEEWAALEQRRFEIRERQTAQASARLQELVAGME